MQNAALEGVRLYPGDQKYRFYYGSSLAFEGRIQEAIRELDAIHEHRDLCLGALLALIYAHRQCKTLDREAITQLESSLRDQRKSATEASLYFAGLFLIFVRKYEKARDYIERMYKMSPTLREGQIAKGWLELHFATNGGGVTDGNDERDVLGAAAYFETAASLNDPEGLLGKAEVYAKAGQHGRSMEVLSKAIVTYHNFVPAYIEKAKQQVALKDWDEALDTVYRTANLDRHCIDTQRLAIIHCLVWEAKEELAVSKLTDLLSSLELREPKNLRLCLETGRLFSRLADQSREVLNMTVTFVERAALLDSNNPEVHCEFGHHYILLDKYADAQRYFKNATKLDESNLNGLIGLLYTNILEDSSNAEALEQLEALEEFNQADGLTNELLYLCALSGERRGKSDEQVIKYLDQISTKLLNSIADLPLGLEFYLNVDPEMTCNVVRLYLESGPAEPLAAGQPLPPVLKYARDILQPIVNSCPSLKEPLYLMSCIKYMSGDSSGSLSLLEKCLEANQSFSHGHMLKAKLLASQGHLQTATQCLEMALSHNFQVKISRN